LMALGRTCSKGLAVEIATWLDSSNMNIKKTAADALAVAGTAAVVSRLLYWLARHDNPGFQTALLAALKTLLGTAFCSVLVDELAVAAEPRAQELLATALHSMLSADEWAAILHVRAPTSQHAGHWCSLVVRKILAGQLAFRAGTLLDFDVALRRRNMVIPIPEASLDAKASDAWRTPALRSGAALREILRSSTVAVGALESTLMELQKANVDGALIVVALERWEVHTMMDWYPELSEAARAGALQVLAVSKLDPVTRLRATRFLYQPPNNKVPPELMICRAETMSSNFARTLLDWPTASVREASAKMLLLENGAEYTHIGAEFASGVIDNMLRRDEVDACFEWCRKHDKLAALVRSTRIVHGAARALELVKRWTDTSPATLRTLLPEVTRLGGIAEQEVMRLAQNAAIPLDLRVNALAALQSTGAIAQWRTELQYLVQHEHAVVREQAAHALLEIGSDEDRKWIFAAYADGRFRESFMVSIVHADGPVLRGLTATSEGATLIRIVRLVSRSIETQYIRCLIDLWKRDDAELKKHCRDALRTIPVAQILAFAIDELDGGVSAILDVVGATRTMPRPLVARFVVGDAAWTRFATRVAGGSILHAPGLSDLLLPTLSAGGAWQASLPLIALLSDWTDPAKQDSLVNALTLLLKTPVRAQALTVFLAATAEQPADIRARLLNRIALSTDLDAIAALVDLVLSDSALRKLLSPSIHTAVDQQMTAALGGDPERARRVLSHLSTGAKTNVERVAFVEVLERALLHRSPRVRMHAHRLLRTHAERPRYLAATRPLLQDSDSSTVRTAIRVLAFGGDIASVEDIARHLSHRQSQVRDAARDGLLQLGSRAVSALQLSMRKARPDRREPYAQVLASIQAALAGDTVVQGKADEGE
jgi:HEAT repeat protein